MIVNHKHKQIPVPDILTTIPDAPESLFAIGDTLNELLKKPRIAIVGSRKMTPYGRLVTEKFASELAGKGIVIVSGLAYGVDACAHQTALTSGGKCIAVLACGLDQMYPAANKKLADNIVEKGGVILSEYPKKTEPLRHHFLARNRIISGLADAVLITEAAQRSGSLNTSGHALNQGMPVMAIPGNINSLMSGGTNNLIKSGAHLISEVSDVLSILKLDEDSSQQSLPVALSKEEYIILSLLKEGISDGLELQTKSDLDPAMYGQTLTMLEISGKVKPLGNNKWAIS
ncbi:MAG TPA: DNA-processing protein DprA [Candidatus Saccharibacteria bacterium]|nr:DNA-processing protein DprA [Candidatus Saccharibacteria bacterium]